MHAEFWVTYQYVRKKTLCNATEQVKTKQKCYVYPVLSYCTVIAGLIADVGAILHNTGSLGRCYFWHMNITYSQRQHLFWIRLLFKFKWSCNKMYTRVFLNGFCIFLKHLLIKNLRTLSRGWSVEFSFTRFIENRDR